jgi:hypothetical protein
VTAEKNRKGTRTQREVGQYGNKRGVEAQKRRRELRHSTPRVAEALEKARVEQARIDALAAENESNSNGRPKLIFKKPVPYVPPVVERTPETSKTAFVYQDARKPQRERWALRDTITMLLDGYRFSKVVSTTGWDLEMIQALARELDVEDW